VRPASTAFKDCDDLVLTELALLHSGLLKLAMLPRKPLLFNGPNFREGYTPIANSVLWERVLSCFWASKTQQKSPEEPMTKPSTNHDIDQKPVAANNGTTNQLSLFPNHRLHSVSNRPVASKRGPIRLPRSILVILPTEQLH
jgi:hypothetical protein